jgi:DNA-binding phage protein
MELSKIFGKAMVDNEVKGFKQLSELAGISYERTIRIMKDEPSAKMVDVIAIADCLNLKLKFVCKGE